MGTAFLRKLDERAVGLTRQDLDLARPYEISAVLDRVDPSAVINCAGYTQVDKAEDEEDVATQINGAAVGALAEWCARRKRQFLTFSTDYVFGGQANTPYLESSPTDPINAYGRSKLVGEQLATHLDGLVVRTSWVISGSHPNFVATMLRLASRQQVRVVDDQYGCPTVAADLAETSWRALNIGVKGLLHVTNQGATTWYELARSAIELAGIDPDSVRPCSTDDFPTRAKRPAYSVLGSERLNGFGIAAPPHWESSLPGVVSEIATWL